MRLVPSLTLSQFRTLSGDQLRLLKSCEVTHDGEYLFTAVIPPKDTGISLMDTIRTNAEYVGYRGNTVGGKTLEEVKGETCHSTNMNVPTVEDTLTSLEESNTDSSVDVQSAEILAT